MNTDSLSGYEYSVLFESFSFQYRSQSEPTLMIFNFKVKPGEKVLIVGPFWLWA
jgi:energy-coupling factor transport system ATP-binding protein